MISWIFICVEKVRNVINAQSTPCILLKVIDIFFSIFQIFYLTLEQLSSTIKVKLFQVPNPLPLITWKDGLFWISSLPFLLIFYTLPISKIWWVQMKCISCDVTISQYIVAANLKMKWINFKTAFLLYFSEYWTPFVEIDKIAQIGQTVAENG